MTNRSATHSLRAAALLLLFTFALAPGSLAQAPPFAPVEAVLGQAYSVTAASASTGSGIHPADIAGANGLVFVSCADLGLLCNDPATGALDDLAALSFGRDFNDMHLPAIQFSVRAGAAGRAGTAVAREASCNPGQANADVFETTLNGSNAQDLDGDGTACSTNTGFGLGLFEPPAADEADELDALAQDPCQAVDFDCDGIPDQSVMIVLAAGSPSLAFFGATPADILVTRAGELPEIWASGIDDLGLQSGDAIDALCAEEDGDGIFDAGDNILFSLTPGSPSLAQFGAGPGALLTASPLQVIAHAVNLGLETNDDLDALACGALVVRQEKGLKFFLPAIDNNPP